METDYAPYYISRFWANRDREDTPTTSGRLHLVRKTADILATDH